MSEQNSRREFIRRSTLAAAGVLSTGAAATAATEPSPPELSDNSTDKAQRKLRQKSERKRPRVKDVYEGFSRFKPSRGDNPDGDYYLGKSVPGFRAASAGPAPFVAPGLNKLPFTMKNGVKEFQLVCQPVQREFLPGYWMNVYGYNGSMPGPTIEVFQGDRVRFVVTNELPEDTTVHWHGLEMPVQYDGADTMTQNPIKPGSTFVYEFDIHEAGTYFYHSHVPMQEAFGMVGWLIIHPQKVYDPPVDRDFGIIFQNFFIEPNQTIADSWRMDWNWHTMNGRSGPYFSPLVVKHGERVRVRIMDFSPMQHHPIHLHGHTFWLTGHEGARIPKSAWIPRNTELIGIAQASDFEFIANNPGDWMFHCHMVHHMMNHMTQQVGPRMRPGVSVDSFLQDLDHLPKVTITPTAAAQMPPGYPQGMQGMEMNHELMMKLWARREVQGMRATSQMSMMGLMTCLRVLPADLYHRVMETEEEIPKGAIFSEIVQRFGDPNKYQVAPPLMQQME